MHMRETDTNTDREREGQTGRQADRKAISNTETGRQTDGRRERETDRQTGRQRQTDRLKGFIYLIYPILNQQQFHYLHQLQPQQTSINKKVECYLPLAPS